MSYIPLAVGGIGALGSVDEKRGYVADVDCEGDEGGWDDEWVAAEDGEYGERGLGDFGGGFWWGDGSADYEAGVFC